MFLDHTTTREAQAVRKNKGRFTTPDRPDTNLAYSMTGKGAGVQTEMARALAAAGITPTPRRNGKGQGKRKPQDNRPANKAKAPVFPKVDPAPFNRMAQAARKVSETVAAIRETHETREG